MYTLVTWYYAKTHHEPCFREAKYSVKVPQNSSFLTADAIPMGFGAACGALL